MTFRLFALKKIHLRQLIYQLMREMQREREREKSHTSLDNMLLFLEKNLHRDFRS